MSPVHLLSLQIAFAWLVTLLGGSSAGRLSVPRTTGAPAAGVLVMPMLQLAQPRVAAALFPAASLPAFELVGRFALLMIVFFSVVAWRHYGSPIRFPRVTVRALAWGAFAVACVVARAPLSPLARATLATVTLGYILLLSGAAASLLRRVEAQAAMRGGLGSESIVAIVMLITLTAWLAWWLGVPPEFGAAELALAVPTNAWFAEVADSQLQALIRTVLVPVLLVCVGLHLRSTAPGDVARWWVAAPLALALRPARVASECDRPR